MPGIGLVRCNQAINLRGHVDRIETKRGDGGERSTCVSKGYVGETPRKRCWSRVRCGREGCVLQREAWSGESCLADQKQGVSDLGVEYADVRHVLVGARGERAMDDVRNGFEVVGLVGMLRLELLPQSMRRGSLNGLESASKQGFVAPDQVA